MTPGSSAPNGISATPATPHPLPVLETRGLVKRFGGLKATDNVTFRLEKGARHALIGPNGAGKTTFINLLTGVLRQHRGRFSWKATTLRICDRSCASGGV